MATPLTEIPIPPGHTADEADFYRRGFRDGESGRDPQKLDGYAANLKLAYATGGMAGALAARRALSEAKKPKAHARIGHERSLCGLAPKNGQYRILTVQEFAVEEKLNQCSVCVERVEGRGYKLPQLRKRFLAEQEHARQGNVLAMAA